MTAPVCINSKMTATTLTHMRIHTVTDMYRRTYTAEYLKQTLLCKCKSEENVGKICKAHFNGSCGFALVKSVHVLKGKINISNPLHSYQNHQIYPL